MKRKILFAVALLATMTAAAQNIAAVSPSNTTTIYQTLEEAIVGAESGSTIYLPGGGFQISDETKINKKLTIMGVSHRGDTDNVDGATVISGNIWFNEGSSGSSILGCYISGQLNIGEDGIVDNVTVKLCNLDKVLVKNSKCTGTIIDNCYIRGYPCSFANAEATVKNNIMQGIQSMTGGIVKNNILTAGGYIWHASVQNPTFGNVHNVTICNNILLTSGHIENYYSGQSTNNSGLLVFDNMAKSAWGEDAIVISAEWTEVFTKYNNGAISPTSKFHFTDEYKQYENQVGIYGGTGFKDEALAPIPRIVSKKVDESTDGSGKLQIEVTVKAQ